MEEFEGSEIIFKSEDKFKELVETDNDKIYLVPSPCIIETYKDAAGNWYRISSDGWVEQGGRCNAVAYNNSTKNVTFKIEMADTSYYANATPVTDATNDATWSISARVAGLTTTQMTVRGGKNSDNSWTGLCTWEVKGYRKV